MKVTLDKTPPELAADIMEQGIVLAGGGALLHGLDARLTTETGMPIVIAENPLYTGRARLGPVPRGVRGAQGRAVLLHEPLSRSVVSASGASDRVPAREPAAHVLVLLVLTAVTLITLDVARRGVRSRRCAAAPRDVVSPIAGVVDAVSRPVGDWSTASRRRRR